MSDGTYVSWLTRVDRRGPGLGRATEETEETDEPLSSLPSRCLCGACLTLGHRKKRGRRTTRRHLQSWHGKSTCRMSSPFPQLTSLAPPPERLFRTYGDFSVLSWLVTCSCRSPVSRGGAAGEVNRSRRIGRSPCEPGNAPCLAVR